MPFFRRNKGAKNKPSELAHDASAPIRAGWQSTWTSVEVIPDEIEELVHLVTAEMKLRAEALDTPFLLLPFRPNSDPSPARNFINTFFKANASGSDHYRGTKLQQEIRLTDPAVLCSVLKWCWSRMPKGVVSWAVYESFQLGEKEAGMARNAFDTFIPLGSESPARTRIIFDFFDLVSAIAAHGKLNGLPGRKLSRLAGWWAFEHSDGGKGFEGGYRSWSAAADASSHLFFAYLRSLSPDVDPSMNVIERIPRSLQALLAQTEYPPETPTLLQRTTPRVVMVVDQVSPSPFSLLRRAKHFEYRSSDRILKDYSEFDDPVDALTEECKRVLYAIASTNSSGVARSRHGLAKPEESWSSFTSTGFSDINADLPAAPSLANGNALDSSSSALSPRARALGVDRPTTPSWGDFLSSGFHDEVSRSPSTMLLPPDKVLPPISSRTQTPSIVSDIDEDVTPGELAAITSIELDDSFWWVWMTSLAGEEPHDRKAVFGRCALIETSILNGKWLIMEEQVKGASPDPLEGAQIVEKKSRFSFSRRSKLARSKSTNRKQTAPPVPQLPDHTNGRANRMTIDVSQQAKIKAAAAELQRRNDPGLVSPTRRGRHEESIATKTASTFTMGLQSEAGPAMKWANTYDKDAIRSAYLGSNLAGTGQTFSTDHLVNGSSTNLTTPSTTTLREQRPVEPEITPMPAPVTAAPVEVAPQSAYDPASKEIGLPTTGEHPALREHEDEEYDIVSPQEAKESNAAVIAAKMALEGRAISPESTRSGKLVKKQQPGQSGLKKFFSRNKDNSKRQSADINPGAMSAAHDATVGRKLVSLRQNTGPSEPTHAAAPVEPQFHEPELVAPVMPASQGQYNESTAGLSRVDSEDQRDADIAFSRFDQGPLQDMPAAVGRDSVDYHSDAAEPPTIARYSPRNPHPQRFEAPPPMPPVGPVPQSAGSHYSTTRERMESDDVQSEATMEERKEIPAAPSANTDASKDRWERIRENAARRAANAKTNDDTSATSHRPTESGKTDDGDTSGEETIESRVARIKARVAELTGNMPIQSPVRS